MTSSRLRNRLLPALLVALALGVLAPGALAAPPSPEAPGLPALQAEVEKVRSLRFLRPVRSESRTLEEAGRDVREMLHEELAVPSTALREAFLVGLDLLPPGARLESLMGRLLGEQVRGLYDPRRQVFLVVRGASQDEATNQIGAALGLDVADLYALHELEHALQDQHFHLLEAERRTGDRFDRVLALQALVEGDANLVMFDAAARRLGLDPEVMVEMLGGGLGGSLPGLDGFPELEAAPRFMREYLTMPYFSGLAFVAALRRSGGWSRVDGAFQKVPLSTEQVLHPEKYLQGVDPPQNVDLSGLPREFGTYRLQGEDTAGEFVIRVWGEEHLGTDAGRQAAEGWGGDAFRVYSGGGNPFVVWATSWDTEADAREFEALARQALVEQDDHVERQKARVLVILDVPGGLAQEVVRAAWKAKIEP